MRKPFQEALATFRKAHQEGLRALKERDFKTLERVIAVERDLIQAQRKIIQEEKDAIKKRR